MQFQEYDKVRLKKGVDLSIIGIINDANRLRKLVLTIVSPVAYLAWGKQGLNSRPSYVVTYGKSIDCWAIPESYLEKVE